MQGLMLGRMTSLVFFQDEVMLTTMSLELVRSSEIEGEDIAVNERQRKIINMQFDGFFGKLTSGKWAKIGKCLTDTALNDIRDLVNKGLLKKNDGGGRSTNYSLVIEPADNG